MSKSTKMFLSRLAGILTVLAVLAAGVNFAKAQTNTNLKLSISPPRFELSVNPGDVINESFRIVNGSDKDLTLSTSVENFVANNEVGGVSLTGNPTPYSLASWITVSPTSVTVPAKKIQDFKFTINVPQNAEPGSHLGAVIVRTNPGDLQGSGAKVSEEAATLILVSVSGNIKEEAKIVSFATDKNFYQNPPVTFETRIENTGNVHFKPSGTITIKNMFGKEVTRLNLDELNVLPSTVRKISTEWKPSFTVGRYTAELTMVYGNNKTIQTASTSFTVFPYKVIVPLFILAIAVIVVLFKMRKRFKNAFKALAGKN